MDGWRGRGREGKSWMEGDREGETKGWIKAKRDREMDEEEREGWIVFGLLVHTSVHGWMDEFRDKLIKEWLMVLLLPFTSHPITRLCDVV